MSEKIISETFTSELGKRYKEAWKETENSCDVFCCATADYTTDRNLDLSSGLVFCEEKTGGTKIKRKEYRLQAYLIKKALNNGKYLQIGNKKWLLLDAERTFAGNDIKAANNNSIKAQGRKRLDILAYEEETNTYVILELKAARDNIYKKAAEELDVYCRTIEKYIDDANNNVYRKTGENVCGYIVLPCQKHIDDDKWGIIEYDLKSLDHIKDSPDTDVVFNVIREPKKCS